MLSVGRGPDKAMVVGGLQIGPYLLERKLGQGGMGSVWLAQHVRLGHFRAFKFLNPELTSNPSLVQRFQNEAMATARLKHPGLVAVHNIDQLPSGEWFMELDYLEGKSLDGWLRTQSGPIPPTKIAEFLTQVCDCLEHVHRLGAVHRDLKPDNLFVVTDERGREQIKVLDLGVAQLSDSLVAGGATQSGSVIGTVLYMAPEQLRGEKVTPAADIYALGVIAFEMASGGWGPYQHDHEPRGAYTSLHPVDMAVRHRTTMPTDIRVRHAALPSKFASTVMHTLHSDPARRPASVSELAHELAEAVRGELPAAATGAGSRADRYQIVKKLGEGGMAEVFLAKMRGEHGFERTVALKRVLPELAKRAEFARLFIDEAKLASRLAHANIVSVLDFSPDSDGVLFLAMEYIHGCDLAKLVDAGPIPIPLAIYIASEMLRALAYVHNVPDPDRNSTARGLVHRDISPHNVMLAYDGTIKVMDFGLARVLTASGRALTQTVRGKVAYMAPEQALGERLDGRADLWAVGVVLWEMLAHEPLFGGTTSECLAQVMHKEIPPPSFNGRRVPPDVEAAVAKLLVRSREGRYPNAEAALRELLACRDVWADARGELARLLAQLVPDSEHRAAMVTAPALASARPQASADPVAAAVVPHATLSGQPYPTPVRTTLGGAASERIRAVRPKRSTRGRIALAAFLAACAAAGTVVAIRVRSGGSPEHAATDPPNGPVTSGAASGPSAPTTDGGTFASSAPPDAEPPGQHEDASTAVVLHDAGVRPDASTTTARVRVAPPVVPVGRGELVIFVKPWADVWLDGKKWKQTPFREDIPAGPHALKLVNEDSGRTERIPITVKPGETMTVERDWR